MNAVWLTTATDSAASESATMVTPDDEFIRPNEIARASGTARTR